MAGEVNGIVATGSEAMALRLAAALNARHRARGLHHFADRLNPLERYTDGELRERVRFDRRGLLFITDLLLLDLQSATNRSKPMPPILQVYAALRYYASGSFQQVTGDTLGLCQRSVSKALRKVTLLLNGQMAAYIHFPTTQDEISAAKAAWYNIGGGGFPGIVGAVDGCAIRIRVPEPRNYISCDCNVTNQMLCCARIYKH